MMALPQTFLNYTGRNFPRPWQFSTDVVTWTRLVFKHPQYTQQEEGRSKKSPPQSPGLILNPLDLRGTSNGAVEDDIHINNQQGKEPNNSQRQNGIPPPPHEGMSDLSIPPDHEVILPPPKGFEDEESLKSTRNEGESLIEEITPLLPRMFSPTATHQHTSRAVSEPPPTIPNSSFLSLDQEVVQGPTLKLPSSRQADNTYPLPPPK